ncbi:MAG: DegV family protein [Actinomycetota bacterium]|nr:DegV family protein [Actinomycetota bacterium]
MNTIAIVTDSTSDLPRDISKEHKIHVVPLSVMFSSKKYIDDGIEIKEEHFYEMIKDSSEMPKAAPPSPGDFLNVYRRLLQNYKGIISLHISRKLSGTLNSVELAVRQLEEGKILYMDSEVVHMPCGFMAIKAAQLAEEISNQEEIIGELADFRKKINSFFIPKSLENLIKGGRINKIMGLFANLLEVKPILTLKDGEVSLYKNSRRWELTKNEVLDSMEKLIKGNKRLTVSIGDVASKEEADEIESRIRQRFNPANLIRTKIGIVVGSHLGIGGLGITFFED